MEDVSRRAFLQGAGAAAAAFVAPACDRLTEQAGLRRLRYCFFGASNYPHNVSYNPTGTVGALAYWAADAIVSRYLGSPGPLIGT